MAEARNIFRLLTPDHLTHVWKSAPFSYSIRKREMARQQNLGI
jgi:hypothetical protein